MRLPWAELRARRGAAAAPAATPAGAGAAASTAAGRTDTARPAQRDHQHRRQRHHTRGQRHRHDPGHAPRRTRADLDAGHLGPQRRQRRLLGQARAQSLQKDPVAPGRAGQVVAAQHVTDQVIGVPAAPCHGAGIGVGPCGTAATALRCVGLAIGQGRDLPAWIAHICGGSRVHRSLLGMGYQRFPSLASMCGRRRSAMASRARKIRERTVPIGQFMASAISS